MQESICADAASFDLPSSLLTACIAEANSCVNLSVARGEMSSDKSCNPDHFAVLKGKKGKKKRSVSESLSHTMGEKSVIIDHVALYTSMPISHVVCVCVLPVVIFEFSLMRICMYHWTKGIFS